MHWGGILRPQLPFSVLPLNASSCLMRLRGSFLLERLSVSNAFVHRTQGPSETLLHWPHPRVDTVPFHGCQLQHDASRKDKVLTAEAGSSQGRVRPRVSQSRDAGRRP